MERGDTVLPQGRVKGFRVQCLGFKGVSTGLHRGDIGTRFRGGPKA